MNGSTIYISYTSWCADAMDASEEFGDWSEEWHFSVNGASLSPSSDESFLVNSVKPGDTIYVLYLVYSDGDSFGTASGKGLVLWAFANKLVADAALAQCQHAINKENQSFEFLTDGGKKVSLGNPTTDYFTDGDVHIAPVKLTA